MTREEAQEIFGEAPLQEVKLKCPMSYCDRDFEEGDSIFAPQELVDNWKTAGIV